MTLPSDFTPNPDLDLVLTREIDLRPGGIFRTVMRGPDGEEGGGTGCYLEVVDNERLVWTGTLGPGYRPNPPDDMAFTAIISIVPTASGTRYTAVAMHSEAATAAKHADMGFHEGWGAALDQLVAMVKSGG